MYRSRIMARPLAAAALLLVLGVSSALAKPKSATGSKCSSDWVNNEGAMQCFIQGEEDVRAGVKHPHYVACQGGDIFCCKDNDDGGQDCAAQAKTRPPSKDIWIRAILAAQLTHLKTAEQPPIPEPQPLPEAGFGFVFRSTDFGNPCTTDLGDSPRIYDNQSEAPVDVSFKIVNTGGSNLFITVNGTVGGTVIPPVGPGQRPRVIRRTVPLGKSLGILAQAADCGWIAIIRPH
jgi:hypothetical protein